MPKKTHKKTTKTNKFEETEEASKPDTTRE